MAQDLKKGDPVEVVGTRREFQEKYMGLKGTVSRNRGWGEFEVIFSDGKKCAFHSEMLKKIEVAQG
jgi:hypothetical protein